jgi:hypothetical protein
VAHALTPHLGEGYLNSTLLTHYTTMLEAFVLAAETLIVTNRAKDLGAK